MYFRITRRKNRTKQLNEKEGVMKRVMLSVGVTVAFALCMCVESFAQNDSRSLDELIGDLKADRVFGNARDARRALLQILNPQVAELKPLSRDLVRKLEQALLSKDYQQRQNVALLLRRTSGYQPSRDLLLVTVEGLRDDSVPQPSSKGGRRVLAGVFGNASAGTEYLAGHLGKSTKLLEAKLESDCQQQRILCAAILATEADAEEMARYVEVFRGGLKSRSEQQRFLSAYLMGVLCIKTDLERVTGILAEHLKDNDIPWDAKLATQALSHLGVDAHLYLAAIRSSDAQQQHGIDSVRQHLVARPIQNRKVIPGCLRFIWSHRYLKGR
jgi:hypothetical protein